jgi:hypothetical protein
MSLILKYLKKNKINDYDIKFYIRMLILLHNNSLISHIDNLKDEKDGFYISYEIEINKIQIIIKAKPENDIFKTYRILFIKGYYSLNFLY